MEAEKKHSKINKQLIGLLVFIAAAIVVMSFISSNFLSTTNMLNILRQSVFVMLMGFGMTFVLTTGGIDLSVGVVFAIAGAIMGYTLNCGGNIVVAIILGALAATGIGVGNGILVAVLHLTPFIATLATMSIGRGMIYILTNALPIRNYVKAGTFSQFLGQGSVGPIPFPIIIAVVALLILWFVFNRMRFGRHVVAVGSNVEAAKLSGINVTSILIRVYALCGFLVGLAGMIMASRLRSVQPELGEGYELDAIAAALLGGTSLNGGKGSLVGTFLGAFIIYLISNIINILNLDTDWEKVVKGIVILVVVAVEVLIAKKNEEIE